MSRWRKPTAVHDPGKTVLLDLLLAIAVGSDCLADVSLGRAQPELFGQVASDPTISRLIDALGADPVAAVAAVRAARASARAQVWRTRDSDAGVREFVHHIHDLRLQYSVGVYSRQPLLDALEKLPRQARKKALDTNSEPREGALVAELTTWLPATFAG